MQEEAPVVWGRLEQNLDKAPSKRSGHTLTALGTSAFLFGGELCPGSQLVSSRGEGLLFKCPGLRPEGVYRLHPPFPMPIPSRLVQVSISNLHPAQIMMSFHPTSSKRVCRASKDPGMPLPR